MWTKQIQMEFSKAHVNPHEAPGTSKSDRRGVTTSIHDVIGCCLSRSDDGSIHLQSPSTVAGICKYLQPTKVRPVPVKVATSGTTPFFCCIIQTVVFFCGGIWKACEAFFWGQASWYNQKSEMDRSLPLGLGWPTMATNAIVTIAAGSSPVAWRLKWRTTMVDQNRVNRNWRSLEPGTCRVESRNCNWEDETLLIIALRAPMEFTNAQHTNSFDIAQWPSLVCKTLKWCVGNPQPVANHFSPLPYRMPQTQNLTMLAEQCPYSRCLSLCISAWKSAT